MPKYQITSPDGKSWEVNAPEGASQDQVLEYAKSQWSKGPSAAAKPELQIEDPGFMQSALIGAGRTFDRIGKGARQLYHGVAGNQEALARLKAEAESDDAAYSPLQKLRPWATGIGESLPSMVIPAGGGATLLASAGRMGLAGALPGALEYGSAGERAQRALIGGAAGAAFPVLAAGAKSVKSLVEPLYQGGREAIAGRTLNRAAGDSAAAVRARMASAQSLVPGSMPTAAEVAESGGIAAMQRAASATNPEAYTQRAMEQASARLNSLRGIAKDGAALTAAEEARNVAAKPLYDQAKAATMKSTPELAAVLDSLPPEVMAKAQRLAKMAMEPLKVGRDLPERTVASGLVDAAGNAMTSTVPAQTAAYSGKALHYIKLALDDSLSKTGENSLGNVEKGLMTGAKESLLEAVDAGIPMYGQARQKFAEMSRPVNQMQVGQDLYKKVSPALSDYGALGQESAAKFGQAMREGDATAARATGFKGATMRDVLDAQQIQSLEAIAKDLARKSNAQNLGRGIGSDTFQKLSMGNIAAQSGMPRAVGGLLDMPGLSRATSWAYRDTDQKMQGLLADALLDPKKAAELMSAADKKWLQKNPALRQLFEQSALRGGGLLGLASTPSFTD